MEGHESAFEGYGYRTSSRFGSWTKVMVDGGSVSITGPRVAVLPYRLWIAAQVLLLVLIVPALVAAVAFWDWRYLVLALGLLAAHFFVGAMGAAGMWECANMLAIESGHPTHSFPVSAVKRVKVGPGWARNGLWLVILPYMAGLNKTSEGHCVSFEAPAGDTEGNAVYASHMRTEAEAQALARLLQGE